MNTNQAGDKQLVYVLLLHTPNGHRLAGVFDTREKAVDAMLHTVSLLVGSATISEEEINNTVRASTTWKFEYDGIEWFERVRLK